MKMNHNASLFIAAIFLSAGSVGAQSLATGDSRSVSEPAYPGVCQTLYANFSSSQRSSPPATDDTSRLQDALNQCAGTGRSVVLAPSGSNDAHPNLYVEGGNGFTASGVSTAGGSPSLSNIVVNGAYATQSLSGAYTKIDGRNASYPVHAWLANVSLDATAQSGDQYANVGLYNSNVTPSGTGVTTSSFTTTGSLPNCAF
ncbi:hypothetical protein [Paraburkholderia sp. BR10954]|uniref:hypothetical protein n=1 Tax=Paraburkholderia sp. BR10954 TaxID=3236995 RepID=UPI0034D29B6C